MSKKVNRKNNIQYREKSNRSYGFGLVSYLLLLLLIAALIVLQGCEIDTISKPQEELQTSQQEELEKRINEITRDDSNKNETEEIKEDKTEDSDQALENSMFTVINTSLLDASVNIETDYDNLSSIVYNLDSGLGMQLMFINVLGKKGIRIEVGENSFNCYIDINQMQAKVVSGEYENFSIKINAEYLYLYNDEGAYIFES